MTWQPADLGGAISIHLAHGASIPGREQRGRVSRLGRSSIDRGVGRRRGHDLHPDPADPPRHEPLYLARRPGDRAARSTGRVVIGGPGGANGDDRVRRPQ